MPSVRLAQSYAYCECLARRHAGNFYHAFRILPRDQRQGMCALYTFMRVADDLADSDQSLPAKQAALAGWRQAFQRCLTGDHEHALHAALQDTVKRFRIPRNYLEAVLDGVEMDLVEDHYPRFEDLYRYCYRVAAAVGIACIHIWGFRDEQARVYAESAGIAFQLTNILRDLREDAARGRIYLPHEDLERFGYRPEELARAERNQAFRALMRFEVERARRYYATGELLGPLLPAAGRAVFQVMLRTYRGLLELIERRDYDVFSSRVSLSRWRKLRLVMQAMPVRLGWV